MVVKAEKRIFTKTQNGRNVILAVLTKSRCSFKKIPSSNYAKVFIEIHPVSQSVSIFLNVNSCKLIKSYIFNKWLQDPLKLFFWKKFKQVRNCFQVFKVCKYQSYFFSEKYFIYYILSQRTKSHNDGNTSKYLGSKHFYYSAHYFGKNSYLSLTVKMLFLTMERIDLKVMNILAVIL